MPFLLKHIDTIGIIKYPLIIGTIMKEYTLLDSLYSHISTISQNLNFAVDDSNLFDNSDEDFKKLEFIYKENFIFCICWLIINLKMLNKIKTKDDAVRISGIVEKLLQLYFKDNDPNYYDCTDAEYFEALRILMDFFLNRANIYEQNMKKGADKFILAHLTFVNYIIDNTKVLEKLPLFSFKKFTYIGENDIFIKTLEYIENIVNIFFYDTLEYFGSIFENEEIINYRKENDPEILNNYILK
jgi:hypothetical protein